MPMIAHICACMNAQSCVDRCASLCCEHQYPILLGDKKLQTLERSVILIGDSRALCPKNHSFKCVNGMRVLEFMWGWDGWWCVWNCVRAIAQQMVEIICGLVVRTCFTVNAIHTTNVRTMERKTTRKVVTRQWMMSTRGHDRGNSFNKHGIKYDKSTNK